MKRFGAQVLLMLLLTSFGIFYGVDLAKQGTEQVHGPLGPAEATRSDTQATGGISTADSPDRPRSVPVTNTASEPESASGSMMPETGGRNSLAGWIGRTLQTAAQTAVEWIVSAFEWFL